MPGQQDKEHMHKFMLETVKNRKPKTFGAKLFSQKILWYWFIIVLATATATAVFIIPSNAYPEEYVRQLLGTVFVTFLPGFALLQTLYPTELGMKASSENLDTVERVALSIGLSIALTAITGLVLNYTPWGIRLAPITSVLIAFTLALATVALFRQLQINKPVINSQNLRHVDCHS